MSNRRSGYCSNGFYAQLQRRPPEPVPPTPRFPAFESTPRTHLQSQSVQQDELQLLRLQQEQSSSQVQTIVSCLTAMEAHLQEITNTMSRTASDSLPASRSRQRVSPTTSVSLLFAPVC